MVSKNWYVYILECSDSTLYTGITNHLEKRIALHNKGMASKYTRARTPVTLVYQEICLGKSEALRREFAIKKINRAEKLKLILSQSS